MHLVLKVVAMQSGGLTNMLSYHREDQVLYSINKATTSAFNFKLCLIVILKTTFIDFFIFICQLGLYRFLSYCALFRNQNHSAIYLANSISWSI